MQGQEDPHLDRADQRTDLAWMNVKIKDSPQFSDRLCFTFLLPENGAISASYDRSLRQSIPKYRLVASRTVNTPPS